MDVRSHWEDIYRSKSATSVSWYRPHLEVSLAIIRHAAQSKLSAILDIGGGASTLVDDLVKDGFQDVSVLDIAATPLDVSRQRLGETSKQVNWIVANFLNAELEAKRYDICHDRAVFHFLNLAEERAAYVHQVKRILRPGGVLILATFALDGPERCSGLSVSRYGETSLLKEIGRDFDLVESGYETHGTPSGHAQQFLYCVLKLTGL